MENHVKTLIEKSAKAEKSEDAMRFSQAACNAANAWNVILTLQHLQKNGSYPQ